MTSGPRAMKHILSALIQFSYVVLSRCFGTVEQSDAGKIRLDIVSLMTEETRKRERASGKMLHLLD